MGKIIGKVLQGAQATPGTTQAYMQISSFLLKSGVTATEKSSLAGGLLITLKGNPSFRQDILKWQKQRQQDHLEIGGEGVSLTFGM